MPVEGERDLEEFLADSGALRLDDDEPRSVGEALAAADEKEEETEVVEDAPPGHVPLPGERPQPPAPSVEKEAVEEEPEEEEAEEEGEPHVVWATKKYGTDTTRWAKAAYDQERFISQLAADKKQAEEAAQEAYAYASQVEANAQAGPSGMPMSAAEEAWVENAMTNPFGYAYQAAMAGNTQLYNAVIERVAEMDPGMAANVGTQVQLTMHQERSRLEAEAQASQQNGSGDFNTEMGQSFQRLGINVQTHGQPMWEKIDELGEYHPYTLAILGGDPIQRDLALQAVYDLVRTGQTTTHRVADTQREEQIKREGELRRNAAGVVTGAPHVEPAKPQSPFFDAMEQEWRRRGQWHDDDQG
jgi:hypothetical protein